MAASEAVRVDVVRLLLERGADARIKNKVINVLLCYIILYW